MGTEEEGATLSETLASLEALERDAASLANEIADAAAEATAALGLSADDAASAARLALADGVLPLSAKDELITAHDRYTEGIRRRSLRLQREGRHLAERSARIAAEAQQLRVARDVLSAHAAYVRGLGIEARSQSSAARRHRQRTVEWAVATFAQRVALGEGRDR